MAKQYYVYFLTNYNNKVLYVGVTGDLKKRVYEHKNKLVEGYTEKYNVDKLVYFENSRNVKTAISREKELKKWRRDKKNQLVNAENPEWNDLAADWF